MAIIYPPSGGKIYGDTKVYPPSGGKIYPGTAYPSGVNPNWPFTDIPLPPFLWRPDLTGDYTNVGSDGAALNLAPGGSGNSFNNGLLLDGNGWAVSPYHPDVSSLGSLFSVIAKGEYVFLSSAGQVFISNFDLTGTWGYQLDTNADPNDSSINKAWITLGVDNFDYIIKYTTTPIVSGTKYTFILTFNAGTGEVHFYINGIEDTLIDGGSSGTILSIPDTGQGVLFGDSQYDIQVDTNTNRMLAGTVYEIQAIAKGTEYTPAQAAEITAGLS